MFFFSESLKIIYLENPKCGSTSIRNFLKYRFDKNIKILQDIVENKTKYDTYHSNINQTKGICCNLNIEFDNYFSFTTIRNPWSKLVSLYHYDRPDKNGTPFYQHNKYDLTSAFNLNFNQWFTSKRNLNGYYNGFYNIDNFAFKNNIQQVTKIYPIESFTIKELCDDITEFHAKNNLEIPNFNFDIHMKLPVMNTREHKHYSTYYSKENIENVRTFFAKDIELGNYVFEEINS